MHHPPSPTLSHKARRRAGSTDNRTSKKDTRSSRCRRWACSAASPERVRRPAVAGGQHSRTQPVEERESRVGDIPFTPDEIKRMADKPYRSLLGSVGYLCLATQPQLSHAYCQLARWNSNYGEAHWNAWMELLGYIRANRHHDKFYITKSVDSFVTAYCDADWNSSDDQRSTTGWVVFMGSTPILWTSRLQQCTARSPAQSEYISLSSLAQECAYPKMFLESLKCPTPTIPVVTHQGDTSKPCKHDSNCNCCAIRISCDSRNAVMEGNHAPRQLD